MNLLVVGANGQLGKELTELLECGQIGPFKVPEVFQGAMIRGVDIDVLDITDVEATNAFLADARPDIVINCAAMTNVDGCETQQDAAFKANALGARNVAQAVAAIAAELLHVSTDYVFPGTGATPYAEWDTVGPNSVYGKSKLLGEQYVRETCPKAYIVRTAWLYGRYGKNFVKTIAKAGREKGALTVVDDQRGNPTNALDLAYHILKIAAGGHHGVYHVTGNGECSWYGFACEIVRLAGISCKVAPCTTEEYPSPTKRPAYSALDHMALRCTVGDEMRDWKAALTDFIQTGGLA